MCMYICWDSPCYCVYQDSFFIAELHSSSIVCIYYNLSVNENLGCFEYLWIKLLKCLHTGYLWKKKRSFHFHVGKYVGVGLLACILRVGLPLWLSGKESTCQCKRCRFDAWVGKIPWRRKWQPTPVFLPGKSMDRETWWATVHGAEKNQTRLRYWTATTILNVCLTSSKNPNLLFKVAILF